MAKNGSKPCARTLRPSRVTKPASELDRWGSPLASNPLAMSQFWASDRAKRTSVRDETLAWWRSVGCTGPLVGFAPVSKHRGSEATKRQAEDAVFGKLPARSHLPYQMNVP